MTWNNASEDLAEARRLNSTLSKWKPNADVNNDSTLNMLNIQVAIFNFSKNE